MRRSGWSASVSNTRSRTFDSGHTVSGMRSRDQAVDEPVVLEAAHAVVDALDAEQVERLPDVLRRAFLPRVRDRAQALGSRTREDARELRRRVAALPRVESDAGEVLADTATPRRASAHRVVFGEVAQEAEDQVRA